MKQEIGEIFFKPNTKFVKWIGEYSKGRLIIDCGAGRGFVLTQQLHAAGYTKLVAIDPQIDYLEKEIAMMNSGTIPNYHLMEGTMERWKSLYNEGNLADKVLLVFARPCHSDWVKNTLDIKGKGVEALYITKPENLKKYDDLGKWKKKAKLLKHEGSSADKEVVYSII